MDRSTLIKGASWVVAWDETEACHVYLRDADVAFQGAALTFVGKGYDGTVDTEIDGHGLMVMPGLVNLHSHPGLEPIHKGLTEEAGSDRLYSSSLYEYLPLFRPDGEGMAAAQDVALAELLLSGVTTVTDISIDYNGWLDHLGSSGIRACVAPIFRSGRWYTDNGHDVRYDWDEATGRDGLDAALRTLDRAAQHPSGRLFGMVSPAQVDTCTAELLRDAVAAADERRLPLQIHAAQSVVEFQEMTRRHGVTPIQWLAELGVLGERTTIGHGIFLDGHSWLHWPTRRDLGLLADSGSSVAHCPTVFCRRGITLQDLESYWQAGVNVGIGTDTFPNNMLEELRMAAYCGRVAAGHVHAFNTADLFAAATVGGARALGRDDIGRLTPGAKADLVVVDLANPAMQPLRDPLRSLIYTAAERAVKDVYVDGEIVVRDGRVLTIDIAAASEALAAAQQRAMANVPQNDWAGRSTDELMPLALPSR